MEKKFTLTLPDTEKMQEEIQAKTAVDTKTEQAIARSSQEQLQAMLKEAQR